MTAVTTTSEYCVACVPPHQPQRRDDFPVSSVIMGSVSV
jgi:hypothetical protein